jgi:hypothetical protein
MEGLGRILGEGSWFFGNWQALRPQERQFVPVASLKDDLSPYDMEEAAASQTQWITPLENGPFSVFKDVLNHTNHLRRGEPRLEHLSDGGSTMDRRLGNLVVDGVFCVEASQCFWVGSIEGFDPGVDAFAWLHAL